MKRLLWPGIWASLFGCIAWGAWTPTPLPPSVVREATTEQGSSDRAPVSLERNRSSRAGSSLEQRRRHLKDIRVETWHRQGWEGQGVKVAVLDTGFRGFRDYLGRGLPNQVQARSFRRDGSLEARPSQHGILCGEIIHAIAPKAELLLANWEPDRPETFLEAVAWAKEEGAQIISCSVIMPSWSDGKGGGAVHRDLSRLLGASDSRGGIFFCACAGNTAQRHWTGVFELDADGWHQWAPRNQANVISPWGFERVAVELYGSRFPHGKIQVVRRGDGRLVGEADLGRNLGFFRPIAVRFDPERGEDYEVRLRCAGVDAKAEGFHLVVLGGELTHVKTQDSIAFPGDGASVVTVGAVDAEGRRKFYSSCGPSGGRAKPDFAARVPVPSICREEPFSGTSAAAPQVAGMAALVLSRHPDWTTREVYAYLRDAAQDLATPGHDSETGHGLARMPAP